MKRLVWLLRWRARELALWTGLLLVAAALAFNWLAVRPLEQRIAALEREQGTQREGRLASMDHELARESSPRMRLASFYAYFARGDKLPDLLAKLHAIAEASGVQMQRAEYRMLSQSERQLDRYQINMPIHGSYRNVRVFIAGALRELPTLSMDQVQFQRQGVGDNAVDAQISFSFHLAK